MWALFSRRIRAWLLFAIALPAVRATVRLAARRMASANPGSRAARALNQADTTLSRFSRRGRRSRRLAA